MLTAADDGLVACPVCSRRMKPVQVNAHLDRCIEGASPPPPPVPAQPAPHSLRANRSNAATPAPSQPVSRATRSSARPTSAAPPLNPIPKLSYTMLNDKTLRAKMRDLGISDSGSRKILVERHREWVNIWNANVDAKYPKTKKELLAALATWERAYNKPANNKTKSADWSDGEWGNKHQDDFKNLIEQARRNVKRRKVEPEDEKTGDEPLKLDTSQTEAATNELVEVADKSDPVKAINTYALGSSNTNALDSTNAYVPGRDNTLAPERANTFAPERANTFAPERANTYSLERANIDAPVEVRTRTPSDYKPTHTPNETIQTSTHTGVAKVDTITTNLQPRPPPPSSQPSSTFKSNPTLPLPMQPYSTQPPPIRPHSAPIPITKDSQSSSLTHMPSNNNIPQPAHLPGPERLFPVGADYL